MGKGARRLLIVLANLLIFWAALPAALYLVGRLFDGLFSFGSPPQWLRWAAIVPATAGAWICAHSVVLLRVKGKGLPISSLPPTTFVASGPYRLFRHPIYTGYTFMAFGAALALQSLGMALVAVPGFAIFWFSTWVKLYAVLAKGLP